jgi:RNA polymerase sigma factor (sigma-70 family)
MLSDNELIRRFAAERSEAAFAELVGRHIDFVYRTAVRQLGADKHLAEDVAQAVFNALAARADRLGSHVVLAGWLYNTTHYTVANVRRAEQRRRLREQELHRMQEDVDNPAEISWERLRPVLDAAMVSLREPDREVLLLRFFGDVSYREMGAALRLSEDAVRMRVERALARLRDVLARHGIVSTTTALAIALETQPMYAAASSLAGAIAKSAAASAVRGAGSATISLLSTMSSSKLAIAGAGLAAAIAIGTAIHERRELDALRRETATVTQTLQQTETRLREDRHRVESLERLAITETHPGKAAQPENAMTTTAARHAHAPVSSGTRTRAQKAGDAFLQRHPEVRATLAANRNASTRCRYLQLYTELNLSAERIAQFESILQRGPVFGRQLAFGTISLELAPALDPAEERAQLIAVLGDPGFERYRQYRRDMAALDVASNLASLSCSTPAPLGPQQAKDVASIVAAAQKQSGGSISCDWDAVISRASAVLSPPQMEQLQLLRTRAESWAQVMTATESP